MNALSYLLVTTFKNKLLSLKKKPALLILYGVMLVFIIFIVVFYSFFENESEMPAPKDTRIIYLIIAGIGFLFMYTFISTGLTRGSTLFTMSDVGLLFVAPVSSKKILIYGLIKEMGKTLLTSIFILFQVSNLKLQFGFGGKEIFAIFIIYAIMIFFCQLVCIGIYIFSNGNRKRKKLVKTIVITAFALIAIAVIIVQRQGKTDIIEAVFRTTNSHWFGFVPIAGWTTMFFKAVVDGSLFFIILPLVLYLIFSIFIITLFTTGNADYYEDVLQSTEFNYNLKMSAKDGRRVTTTRKKVKVREEDQGISRGSGAMTLFYKHLLEMRRGSKFVFVDTYTIVMTIAIGIASYYIKDTDGIYGILGFLVYILFVMTAIGRLSVELTKHYIYLLPEKSIKKVFAGSITTLLKPCVDSIFFFTAMGIIGKINPFMCVFFALAYASSAAAFVGFTILCQKIFGSQPNKLVVMMLGIGLFVLIMSPAFAASIVAVIMLPDNLKFLSTLPYTLCCLLIATLLFVGCGNLIDKAEYTGK